MTCPSLIKNLIMSTLQRNFCSIVRAIVSTEFLKLPAGAFEVLENRKKKLQKYLVEMEREFPKLKFEKEIFAKDALHFSNEEELLSIFLYIVPDSYGWNSLRVSLAMEYYSDVRAGHPISFFSDEFPLEIPKDEKEEEEED